MPVVLGFEDNLAGAGRILDPAQSARELIVQIAASGREAREFVGHYTCFPARRVEGSTLGAHKDSRGSELFVAPRAFWRASRRGSRRRGFQLSAGGAYRGSIGPFRSFWRDENRLVGEGIEASFATLR
jgi:hypothetical protein